MKILKIIHGYPMRYNAGSEVYSQTLCHALAKHHEVQVFTREEDPFALDYSMRTERDAADDRIKLNLINLPLEKHRYCYRNSEVDCQFAKVLNDFKPDIVHIGHLNHLSVSLIEKIPSDIPIIYTLHDYWLMCPRGQFIQRTPKNIWSLCYKQDDQKCAKNCYGGYFSGAEDEYKKDCDYWTNWIARRMSYIKSIVDRIDYFLAPAQYLLQRHENDFAIPESKLIYIDYGFDLERLKNRVRIHDEPFTFGYIGTHIPVKGIQLLIRAFGRLNGNSKLRIWGRPCGQNTAALKEIVNAVPTDIQQRIEWLPEYRNQQIIKDVFNKVDAIVVPSIWVENSPLVIHEALQTRIPVITADAGGMSEYIHHKINGLLFKHRDFENLAEQMQFLADNPGLAAQLGAKGYIQSGNGDIPNIEDHINEIEKIYKQALCKKGKAQ
jgi:glycosyltransferase involved in cell wall biosynthesis